jgi:hypothetical protein
VKTALTLLACLGILGAFDTLYYHEWRARLPARSAVTGPELRLHAWRDFVYAILFGTLPWLAWQGAWALLLAALLLAEITITLADFIVEDKVRAPFGGVFPGERATHGIMAIVYGAMLGNLVPVVAHWARMPTELVPSPASVPPALRLALGVMAAGVFLSGVRDLAAAKGIPKSSWPWEREA